MNTDLLLARRELELEKRQFALRKENGIMFYSPHEKQNLFHSAANYRFRYARTGNRFGKSEMGAAEDVAYALGFRPWYPEGHPLRTLGIPSYPTKGLIVCVSWKKSREVFTETEEGNLGKLFRYIPKAKLLSTSKNHSGFIDRLVVQHVSGGRSVIMLDTVEGFKNNPKAQESSVHDWVHIDEPIPEQMWKAIVRGLTDRGGSAWFTCTPLSEPWIDAEFVPDLQDQTRDDIGVIANATASRWMMTGSMDDNPHLSKEDVALTLSWYTPEEIEARRHGRPLAYSGIVYKEFSWNTHVLREAPAGWKDWSTPPADHCLRFAIDYHPRKPHHVMFIATSPQDRHYVYAEIWRSCLMSELVTEIKSILRREATVPGLIDPLADTPNRVTDITPLEEILRLDLPVMPATKDPYNGILKVKEILRSRDRAGQPTLVFNSSLTRTLFEISRGFQWDEDTNKPKKENDDAMENFYRLCLQGLPYIEPSSVFDYTPLAAREFTTESDFHFGYDADAAAEAAANARYASRYRK